ncbi:MAG: M28 family peptidase [Gammaproteobacteria bacterium]|nr:M28 family peptidase [Gammaproteobacteria bacterium]
MRIQIWPQGQRRWRNLLLRWSLIIGVLVIAMMFITNMPGNSYRGTLPPLDDNEAQLQENLAAHVWKLAGEIGERNVWHPAKLEAAAQYIAAQFKAQGYQVNWQPFDSAGFQVNNLAVEIPGTDSDEIIVIGAHYDAVLGSPAANDNGSGVAAMLEIARLLADSRPERTLRFVAFANEEPPFYFSDDMGSRYYARQARQNNEKIVGMFSLETIGSYKDEPGSQQYPFPLGFFYPDSGDFIAFVSDLSSRKLLRSSVASFRHHTHFPSEGLAAPRWIPAINLSDQWSFWEEGYPALMVTDTAMFRYDHYHRHTDTPEKIDYDRMARVVAGLARVVAELAGIQGTIGE